MKKQVKKPTIIINTIYIFDSIVRVRSGRTQLLLLRLTL